MILNRWHWLFALPVDVFNGDVRFFFPVRKELDFDLWFTENPYSKTLCIFSYHSVTLYHTGYFLLAWIWKKVKCTLVQALRFCTGRTAHRGSRDIALLFLDHGTRRGWGVSVTPRPLFTPGKDTVPIVQEAGWAPGPVWTGAENLAPIGIRSPECPARALYRLRYPAHLHEYSLDYNHSILIKYQEKKTEWNFK